MKLECPYCWQHYEIEKSDLDRELECINCEQTFRVRDALVVENQSSGRRTLYWVTGVMGTVIVLLAVLLVWALTGGRFDGARHAEPVSAARTAVPASAGDLQTVIAPLYRTLKDFRTDLEQHDKARKQLSLSIQQLSVRMERIERQQTAASGDTRFRAMDEGLKAVAIKVEGQSACMKLQEESAKQTAKELGELRRELNALNLANRISILERKAGNMDITSLSRRVDKLEALLNAIRYRDSRH